MANDHPNCINFHSHRSHILSLPIHVLLLVIMGLENLQNKDISITAGEDPCLFYFHSPIRTFLFPRWLWVFWNLAKGKLGERGI